MLHSYHFFIVCIMKLHVVSFQVPFPADYGGVIDVYYKLVALRKAGFEVTLHTYAYDGREILPELEHVCDNVICYRRRTGWRAQLSRLPYIVQSRDDETLLQNLLVDDAPILFEGLHTCLLLDHPALASRVKVVRMHNIEHEYYRALSRQAGWRWKAIYYRIESMKLKAFESRLQHASLVFAITDADKQSLQERFPEMNVKTLPCFFDATMPSMVGDTEPFVLYHGNLSVNENHRVALFIMQQVAPLCPDVRFVIAGRNPNLKKVCDNVEIVPNPTDKQLDDLLCKARIHLMLTFQPTGIKLKLLNTLTRSCGHIIANKDMLHGHQLGTFCTQAETPQQIADAIHQLMETAIDQALLNERRLAIEQLQAESQNSLQLIANL